MLRASRRRLACAESLTGGSVGARMTAAEGASEVFVGSAVVYTAEAKQRVLGVVARDDRRTGRGEPSVRPRDGRGRDGACTTPTSRVSLTGAAGPEPHGGAEPGTVWLGLDADGISHARGYVATGDRARVRRWAEQAALDLVRRHLEGLPLPESDRIDLSR